MWNDLFGGVKPRWIHPQDLGGGDVIPVRSRCGVRSISEPCSCNVWEGEKEGFRRNNLVSSMTRTPSSLIAPRKVDWWASRTASQLRSSTLKKRQIVMKHVVTPGTSADNCFFFFFAFSVSKKSYFSYATSKCPWVSDSFPMMAKRKKIPTKYHQRTAQKTTNGMKWLTSHLIKDLWQRGQSWLESISWTSSTCTCNEAAEHSFWSKSLSKATGGSALVNIIVVVNVWNVAARTLIIPWDLLLFIYF